MNNSQKAVSSCWLKCHAQEVHVGVFDISFCKNEKKYLFFTELHTLGQTGLQGPKLLCYQTLKQQIS